MPLKKQNARRRHNAARPKVNGTPRFFRETQARLAGQSAGKRADAAVPSSGRAGLYPAAIQEKAAFRTTGYDVPSLGHFSFETLRVLPISKAKSAGRDGRTRAAAKRRYAGKPASRRKGRTAAVWAGSRSKRRKDSAGKERRKRAYLLRRTTRLREDRQERRQRWIGWIGSGAGPVLSDGMTTPFGRGMAATSCLCPVSSALSSRKFLRLPH